MPAVIPPNFTAGMFTGFLWYFHQNFTVGIPTGIIAKYIVSPVAKAWIFELMTLTLPPF